MKTNVILTSVFLSLALFSCKNDDKKTDESEKPKVETFDVSVDLIIKQQDELILFYRDGSNQWFDEAHAIWYGVKAKNELQTAKFSLPEESLATDLRLDIGRNEFKNQEPVEIKKITISYKGKSFEVNEDTMENYFKPNEFMVYNPETKLYSFKKNAKEEYDPYFVATPLLNQELAKITGGIK
ncbi:MAG: hypothetical protein CFE23_04340 [Flavobacterium sp. BFFFF1]|uniref:hypothetical protein n=1 Tax=unclassified Flavobacterium TaxID=196869 RepID=UPI000BD61B55|nr:MULTISPECIES: hypothetical protein [unclassified Flavobacterium]OYU81330.1 MAG: hypothetical protein CFE23_04340 [Flavobacterium sp. BFFFF1]